MPFRPSVIYSENRPFRQWRPLLVFLLLTGADAFLNNVPKVTTPTTRLSVSTQSRPTDRNFYAILQVGREANVAEIKGAYRRLAKLYHPGKKEKRKE